MTVSIYPYPLGNITTRQAVELIAKVVYPYLKDQHGRKRVRSRINYARGKGLVPLSDTLNAPEFFRWALDKNPDWAELAKVQGLPRAAVTVALSGHVTIAMAGKCHAIAMPGDPEKLKAEFVRVETERQNLADKVTDQQARITELETEVNAWREKDRQQRAKLSAAGKRGGRGRGL